MSESFESFEKTPVSEKVVIEALNAKGIEDLETLELLGKYADQCHAEADREVEADPENADLPNRANIKAEIKIASVYFKSEKYKADGIASLEEALFSAKQTETTAYLAE